jgi:hypothetical protein
VEGAEVTIPVIEIDVIMVTATGIRIMDPEVTADNTIAIGVIIGITDVTGITDLSRPTEGTIPIKVETTIIEASHRDRRDHVHRDRDSNHGPRDGGQHHRDHR